MFASLGFKVDTSGLDKFKQSISSARHEFTNLNQGVKQSSKHLRSLKSALGSVDTALNKVRGAGANNKIIVSYRDMAKAVENVDKHLRNISSHQTNTTKAIGKINSSVHAGVKHWNDYANAVNRARDALRQVRSRVLDLQHNRNIDINVRERRTGSGASGNGSGSNNASGDGNTIIPLLGRGGIRSLLGASMPAMLLGGGLGSVGYLGTQAVKTGQDQIRMEMALKMSSAAGEFEDTLKYVKSEAMRLGMSSQEMGKAYAQINMAAEKLDMSKKQNMFTGISEYMKTVGMSKEGQAGVYRAVYQMFSKGKIEQGEVRQLAEWGMSTKVFRDSAMKSYGVTDVNKYLKMQRAGKIDPNKVLLQWADDLKKIAHTDGAFEAMNKSSITKMNQFKEALAQLSKELLDSGLDSLLAAVFEQLTNITNALIPLVRELKPVVGAIKEISATLKDWYDGLNEVTGESNLLIFALLLLMGRYRGIAKGIQTAIGLFQRKKGIMMVVSGFMRGAFGKALGGMITKFGGWAIAIWAVSEALKFVYKQMELSKQGKWTFFDDIFAMTELAILKLKNLGLAMTLAVTQALNFAVNPVLASTGNTLMGHITGTTYNPYAKVTPPDQKSRLLSSGSDKGSGGYLGIGGFGANNRQPVSVDAIPRQSSMNKYVVLKANQIQIDAKDSQTILNNVATNPIRTISAMTP